MNKYKDILGGFVAILICEAAGLIGTIFTSDSISTWYTTITKPSFNPPNWIFGPVWTTLFALMGVALYLVWKQRNRKALYIFGAQLVLNILWSVIFFGLHSPMWAFVEIVILWLMILWTILTFYKINKVAAYLLVPYILWVSFASVLNFAIWRLN
jgi:benzodiazapine receptor